MRDDLKGKEECPHYSKNFRYIRKEKAFLLGYVVLSLTAASSTHAHESTVVAETGQLAPGAIGAFEEFSAPSLDDGGNVIFAANQEDMPAGTSEEFESIVWIPTNGDPVFTKGWDAAPHATGSTQFARFGTPELDVDGSIAFRASTTGGLDGQEPYGIWVSSSSNPSLLSFVTRGGSPAAKDYAFPASNNGVFKYPGSPNLKNSLATWFYADLSDGSSGIWSRSTTGNSVLLGAVSGELIEAQEIVDVLSFASTGAESGWVLVSSKETGSSELPHRAIYAMNKGADPQLLVTSGDTLPDSSKTIASVGSPAKLDVDTVAFWVGTSDTDLSEGVYAYSENVLSPIASINGSLTASGKSISYNKVSDPVTSGSGDTVLTLTDQSGEISISYIVFKGRVSSDWTIIAETGQPAPGTLQGTYFKNFSTPIIAPNGDLAFSASLTGEGDAISDTTDSGIWATDPNGYTSLIHREGDNLTLATGLATITDLEVTDINQNNEIIARYGFINGASAIVKIEVETSPPPTITSDIEDTSLYEGANLELSIAASGSQPLSYQWYRDDVEISGAISSTLSLSLMEASDAGEYKVQVNSPFGSISSSTSLVTVLPPPPIPVFTEQPVDTSSHRSETATLSALAVAAQGVTYQWYLFDSVVEGATSNTLVIENATVANSGSYSVVATSPAGSTASEEVILTITDGRLANISARALVGTGANMLINGFVVEGPDPKQLLIRAVGPTLASYNVANPLAEPRIHVYRQFVEQPIYENSGWNQYSNSIQSEILGAFTSAGAASIPTDSEDAVLLVTLDPGVYTAIVSSEDNTPGVGLAEVYEIDPDSDRIVNLSARAYVGIGDNVAITGFVIKGNGPNRVLIQAVGPGISQHVAGVLETPIIHLYNGDQEIIASNEVWEQNDNLNEIVEMQTRVGATRLESGSQDAALLVELPRGVYTVIVSGEAATSGIALIEIYEAK